MKKVISNDELREKINEAISLLCGTVKTTLGPKGNNIIIDHSTFSPFITNDGVTIAQNIESDDEAVNTILELAKEASIKTNETVGDGTTTTLVLLEAIYNEGLNLIRNGLSPIVLKNLLNKKVLEIEKMIKSKSHIPSKNELTNIASISANSNEVGNLISSVYFNINNCDAINIIEGDISTKVKYLNGYILDTNIVSDYYFKDSTEIKISNAKILLINNYLDNINDISEILNYVITNNNSLVIIANDYSELFINEVLSLYINENIKIYLLKNPEYGNKQYSILKDLQAISEAKIIENTNYILTDSLGSTDNMNINRETTIFNFEHSDNIKKRISEIKKELNNDNIEFTNKRIAMFNNGLATISVGALTTAEKRELKMRYDDALCAIKSAINGIIPGCGLTLLDISNNLDDTNEIDNIFKNILITPFKQILYNAGLSFEEIFIEIKDSNYNKIYNISIDEYENIDNTLVLDSTQVVINSLKNACSIASMLLTTSSLVINEYTNNLNKINNYNEL